MFAEDWTQFFDVAGGFALSATWGLLPASVLLDSPSEDILGGQANSNEYRATLPAHIWPGIARGAAITVDGAGYTVRNVNLLDDGALMQLVLTKTS